MLKLRQGFFLNMSDIKGVLTPVTILSLLATIIVKSLNPTGSQLQCKAQLQRLKHNSPYNFSVFSFFVLLKCPLNNLKKILLFVQIITKDVSNHSYGAAMMEKK